MDDHRKADIEINKLLVNPENYRFERVKDQQEAMLIMLRSQKDKILKLARDIAQRGLNPAERLIVKEADDSKYTILEGNRRITALKLLSNPAELSGDYPYKGVFEELHASYKNNLPTAVECVVYPENQQDIADDWVLLKHIGENQGVGTVPWNSVQKKRFESHHKQETSTTLQVLEFLEANGVDISGISATNLERLLTTPQVRHALGFDFSEKKFVLHGSEEDTLQKLKTVVEQMAAKGFSVSEIYNRDDRLKWIQNVLRLQPAPATPPADTMSSSPASTNGNVVTPAPQAAPPSAPSSIAANPRSATTSEGTSTPAPSQPVPPPTPSAPNVYYTLVNPAKILPATIPTKIVKIYKELQTVYISGQRAAPHAVGSLLRILVEITAQEYLMQKHGFRSDSGNHFRSSKNPSRTCDELRDKLNYIANDCDLPGNIAHILKTLTGKQLMTAELNQVIHNTLFTADAAAIKGMWQNYENVFDYLIGEMQ